MSRKLPSPRARDEVWLTVIFGGSRPGSETKLCSFSGWWEVRVSGGCGGPSRATVKLKRRVSMPRIRTVAETSSPAVSGWSSRKLAPRLPE